MTNAAVIRKYDLSDRAPMETEHDYSNSPNISNISEFKKAAISYIAGYVSQMVAKKTLCQICWEALGSRQNSPESSFVALKDRGRLIKPTSDVIKICEETEKRFSRMLASTQGNLPRCKGIHEAIATSVLHDLDLSKVFKSLGDHMFDSAVDDNHVYQLVKLIVKSFCKIRLFHLGKEATQKISADKVRKRLSKLVLFKHQ